MGALDGGQQAKDRDQVPHDVGPDRQEARQGPPTLGHRAPRRGPHGGARDVGIGVDGAERQQVVPDLHPEERAQAGGPQARRGEEVIGDRVVVEGPGQHLGQHGDLVAGGGAHRREGHGGRGHAADPHGSWFHRPGTDGGMGPGHDPGADEARWDRPRAASRGKSRGASHSPPSP